MFSIVCRCYDRSQTEYTKQVDRIQDIFLEHCKFIHCSVIPRIKYIHEDKKTCGGIDVLLILVKHGHKSCPLRCLNSQNICELCLFSFMRGYQISSMMMTHSLRRKKKKNSQWKGTTIISHCYKLLKIRYRFEIYKSKK